MNDEMKLLCALCEALGFEVNVDLDYNESKISGDHAQKAGYFEMRRDIPWKLKSSKNMGLSDIDEDGMYTSVLKEPITSYTLTKKLLNHDD